MEAEAPTSSNSSDTLVFIALVAGVLSLCAWFLPFCGVPITLTGLILGILGRKSTYHNVVIAAVALCVLGLIASIANGAYGAYMFFTGQGLGTY